MAIRDLIPWKQRGRDLSARRDDEGNPFLALHREMNRLFDDAFRSFDLAPFDGFFERQMGWPRIEVRETDKDLEIQAELPGLQEKDVQVELSDGVLAISGEKKSETEDKERQYSERYYGRFERRIPVGDVEPDKVHAGFKGGVLTVTLPKPPTEQQKVKRIPINGK